MKINPYKVLGVRENAPLNEIKSAFRSLAKKHHPDAGGDDSKILEINAAWEILKSETKRKRYAGYISKSNSIYTSVSNTDFDKDKLSQNNNSKLEDRDNQIKFWIKVVYLPIDRLLGEIINPFPKQLKELSGDPYDELLMDSFCIYIKKSQRKLLRIKDIYQSNPSPDNTKSFSLSLYQCFSEVQDAFNELERYTAGYVDNYLHDGQEMIRIAKKKRLLLQREKRNLPNS